MYVPARSTTPWISTGPLKVTYISLSKSLAFAGPAERPATSPAPSTTASTDERRGIITSETSTDCCTRESSLCASRELGTRRTSALDTSGDGHNIPGRAAGWAGWGGIFGDRG